MAGWGEELGGAVYEGIKVQWQDTTPTEQINVYQYDGDSGDTLETGDAPSLNEWHHFAIKTNSTNISYYRDGNFKASRSVAPFDDLTQSDDGFAVATYHDNDVWSYFFNGKIDDVLLFNRSLTSAEILSLNSSGIESAGTTAPTLLNATCFSCIANSTIDSTPSTTVVCIDDISTCSLVRIANDSSLTFDTAGSNRNCTKAL